MLTREIEVRYRVNDVAGLRAALGARRVALPAPVRQDDQVYAPDGWRYGMSTPGVTFARLRTEAGRHLFALKRWTDHEVACRFEAEVADRSRMHEAILRMGFYATVRVGKHRRTARLGEMALSLDEVEHLGAFIKIERVVPPRHSGAAVRADLDAFAGSLGVPLERTTETYDSLVHAALAGV